MKFNRRDWKWGPPRRDHKGYELRPMDRQDVVVLIGCALGVVVLVITLVCWG